MGRINDDMKSLRERLRDVEGSMKDLRWLKEIAVLIFVIFIMLAFSFSMASSVEPPKEPILRIETGMHTAKLWRIGVDAENRYLVTASDDKTVRVWELATGKLMKTLRVPIGEGNEGKLYSVAISPDGRTIACGGWTGWDWEGTASIYLFDRESGALTKRLTGLRSSIDHLAFSRDGRFLVACLGGKNGIRLYRTSDYSQIGEDRDYGDNSFGADFSFQSTHGSTLLATTSDDGYIRLYEVSEGGDTHLSLLSKERTNGGTKPFSISFSPANFKGETRIAVGYLDSTKVDIYSPGPQGKRGLKYLSSPDTTGVDIGDLGNVTWSADGRSLYAGGKYYKNGKPIRKWSDAGKGNYRDIPTGVDNTIMHIIPLKKGGIAFGAADPAFGIIDAKDNKVYVVNPSIADYRGFLDKLLISKDGTVVQFGYEKSGKSPARFSVAEGLLDLGPSSQAPQLLSPVTSAEGLNITEWQNTYTPKLNGTLLKLEQYERSRSLAISPDRQAFLLGTEWSLRLFDREGKEKWGIPVPGVARGVNISGDNRVAVAAFGDGTIRWYQMEDGKELLALFPHKDKRRWVIWSPSGYYAASAGAEDLIGYHLNQGKERAGEFVSASQLKEQFYRPT